MVDIILCGLRNVTLSLARSTRRLSSALPAVGGGFGAFPSAAAAAAVAVAACPGSLRVTADASVVSDAQRRRRHLSAFGN